MDQSRPVILFHFFGDVCIADSFPFYVTDFMIKKYNGDAVELGYTDLGLCSTLAIMLYILRYQFIGTNIIFHEVGYFEK